MFWDRFNNQLWRDISLWMLIVTSLAFFRLLFIVLYYGKIEPESTWLTIAEAAATGLRFDAKVAGFFVLPALILSVICLFLPVAKFATRLRVVLGIAFLGSLVVLGRIAIGYFREYDSTFDPRLFGLYYDDLGSILDTIRADYNIAIEIFAALFVLCAGSLMIKHLLSGQAPRFFNAALSNRFFRAGLLLLLIIGFIGSLRGSFDSRPLQLKDAGVTPDAFLNKAVLNPYIALNYAVREHVAALRGTYLKVFLPDGDVTAAARQLSGIDKPLATLDDYLLRKAAGNNKVLPRHVFLVVMESGDAWPMYDPFSRLRLSEELRNIATNGLSVQYFLPASTDTMNSLYTILTGMPYAGIRANYQPTAQETYPSSLAAIFHRLGYRTRFFYGGYLSWQRLGDFCRWQGFDEVYGGAHMDDEEEHKEWGVDDEILFRFVTRMTSDRTPSLNVIMTTSNHPPFSVDVYGKGFPLRKIPEELQPLIDNKVTLSELGHIWYADRCMGRFISEAESRLPHSLFAVTGDHFSRRYPNQRPGIFDRSLVPFVMYGPQVLTGRQLSPKVAGSHLDIVPTLVELAAPEGFRYHAMGNNLLASGTHFQGVSLGKIITSDYLFDAFTQQFHQIAEGSATVKQAHLSDLLARHNQMMGFGLWRSLYGAEPLATQRVHTPGAY